MLLFTVSNTLIQHAALQKWTQCRNTWEAITVMINKNKQFNKLHSYLFLYAVEDNIVPSPDHYNVMNSLKNT